MMNPRIQLNRRTDGSSAGFTLLEVMLALVILGMGLLAVASMQSFANSKDNQGRYYTDANIWATHMIEGLMSLDFNDPDLSASAAGELHTSIANVDIEDPPEQYDLEYTVRQPDGTNYKIIDLTVSFTGRNGQGEGSVQLTQLKPRAHEVK